MHLSTITIYKIKLKPEYITLIDYVPDNAAQRSVNAFEMEKVTTPK